MATTGHRDQETQELTRLLHQTNQTLSILTYKNMVDERVKHVLNTLSRYEPNHEIRPFSIYDTEDIRAHLTNISVTIQNPKYHVSPNKPVI